MSFYGPIKPTDTYKGDDRSKMNELYQRLADLTPSKPIVLLEFGVTAGNSLVDPGVWTRNALTTAFRWPRLIGFSWWNEKWQNDDNPANDTNMRVQDNLHLRQVFQEFVGNNPVVLGIRVR